MALGLMAALRTFVLDTCTVATYLLGEGIDSRVLHLCEFSTVFYDLIFYSNLFQCRFKDLAQQQHRKRSFLYSSYIFVGGGGLTVEHFIFVSSQPFSMIL